SDDRSAIDDVARCDVCADRSLETQERRMERAVQALVPADNGPRLADVAGRNESVGSGVSWAAVIAGALAAAALSLVLLALGAGLGFSAGSPWANTGASAAAVGSAR